MGDTVIRIENVSKQYRLGVVGTGTIAHDLNRWWHRVRRNEDPYLKIGEENDRTKKGSGEYVWALKDISFDVKQGDVVGIIGRNGAGKSTLLKILSRTTLPTLGTLKVKGRIASLLEVGTGFHPELTGRENVFLNGAILGMTKADIKKSFDEIVDFAGVEKYIDTPVKRYSSGMYVRLAFAVAAHLEPEILIVDEVLAVGDAEFQRKCLGKMENISSSGRTILFVSHNLVSVKALCSRAILIENGSMIYQGDTGSVISNYQNKDMTSLSVVRSWEKNPEAPGNEFIRLLRVTVTPLSGQVLDIDSGVEIAYEFISNKEGINLGTTLELVTRDEVVVFHRGLLISENRDSKSGVYAVKVEIPPALLNSNVYTARLIFGENQRYVLYRNDEVISFEIENTHMNQGANLHRVPGIIRPNLKWSTNFVPNAK